MEQPISTYSFLPYLRQGIAGRITAADMDASVRLRASVRVDMTLTGDGLGSVKTAPVGRDVEIYGPGEIIGIDPRVVIRTGPKDWITNFEPNYLPFVEFYDEDFPWRYTPAAANTASHRLRPWIALVVLEEGEFTEGGSFGDRPLPFIVVPNAAGRFPPAEQLWAWAHVHVNQDLAAGQIATNDMNIVLPGFQALLDKNPDHAYSRLVCPRKLKENAAYHAFLLPVYERGRLAGLNKDPDKAPHATFSAWAAYPPGPVTRDEGDSYPYYYRWYFRTGTVGDFEYLVRLLEPRQMDSRVGRRDMDVLEPGANLPGIDIPDLKGVLRLGGALQTPQSTLDEAERTVAEKYDRWFEPYPHSFQQSLAALINLADEYTVTPPDQANQGAGLPPDVQNDPDPLITPPLYGRWHAPASRLLIDRDANDLENNTNWVHDLNLDPRYRVAAGFGTRVVQENQETYMDAAWGQIGQVLEANRKIRQGQVGRAAGLVWHERHLLPLAQARPEKALTLTAPLHRRVLFDQMTVFHQVQVSQTPGAVVSPAARRILRPGGRLARAMPFTERLKMDNLITRLNAGEVAAAPPKTFPPGAASVQDVADRLTPSDAPSWVLDLLRRSPWLRFVPWALALAILVLMLLFPVAWLLLLGGVAIGGLAWLGRRLAAWSSLLAQAGAVDEAGQTPEAIDGLPASPDFTIARPDDPVTNQRGAVDSPEAQRFKTALKDADGLLVASQQAATLPPRLPLDLPAVGRSVLAGINPAVTFPRRILGSILLPPRLIDQVGDQLEEIVDYPEIDLPMYDPLADISSELFLPNINLIPQNTISLLETNQPFIEAYMVGLNHEFARELLWREYPTNQNGSYFRQFWDVSGFYDTEGLDPEALREKLRDIPRLDRWPKDADLGDNDNRQQGGEKRDELVLVVRGELLKKYPTAVIYAHAADWQRNPDNSIDNTRERVLVGLEANEQEKPPPNKVKTPLYEARVMPDIYFFGFDLDAIEARGGTGEQPDDEPGWFFVIKERPGEPRFGLDITQDDEINVWNDLAWEDVLPGGQPGDQIELTPSTPTIPLTPPSGDEVAEKQTQHLDDVKVHWNKDMSAADLAYILYQVPVMVAVHAAEMLPKND